MAYKKIVLFGVISGLFLLSILQPLAQDSVDVTIFIEEDSLVVSIPQSGTVSLEGFAFEVTVDDESRIWLLQNFDAFQLPFNRIPAPICLRLSRAGTTPILPVACDANRTLTQELNPADVFWYDRVTGLYRTLLISQVEDSAGFCGAGQSQCDITYDAPETGETEIIVTIAPTPAPIFSQGGVKRLAQDGQGLATGRNVSDGQLEADTYCQSVVNHIYGTRNDSTDWFCTYNGWDARRLVTLDFTNICQLTYHEDAFAEQSDGISGINAWRCYEMVDGAEVVPRELMFDDPSIVREALLRRQTNLWTVPDVFDGAKTNTILEGNTVVIVEGPVRGRIRTAAPDDRDDWYYVISTDDSNINGWTWIGNLSAPAEEDRPEYRRRLLLETNWLLGVDVMLVQARLTELGYNPGLIDGYFGRMVEQAVKEFQTSEDIVTTGVVDEDTWAALFGETPE